MESIDYENVQKNTPTTEDDVAIFMHDVRQIPLLSAEAEKELAVRCAAGDEKAIQKMVASNLRLVVSIAKEYAGRGVPFLDLIQEGSIGLIAAANKFDPSLDYRFSTYATKWIRQGVSRCIGNSKDMIRVPLHTADKIRKVTQAQHDLLLANGVEPTIAEIAEMVDMPEERVKQLLSLSPDLCSLDAPIGTESEGTLGDMISDEDNATPYDELVRQEMIMLIDNLMNELNERQRKVLRLHFGMEDGICYSLEQIGQMLGVSKERARQIEGQAMEKMRTMGMEFGLEEFLE